MYKSLKAGIRCQRTGSQPGISFSLAVWAETTVNLLRSWQQHKYRGPYGRQMVTGLQTREESPFYFQITPLELGFSPAILPNASGENCGEQSHSKSPQIRGTSCFSTCSCGINKYYFGFFEFQIFKFQFQILNIRISKFNSFKLQVQSFKSSISNFKFRIFKLRLLKLQFLPWNFEFQNYK